MADDHTSSGPDLLGGPEPTPFPLLAWRDRLALITAIVAAGLAGGLVLTAVTNASGADAYGEFSWKLLGLQLMSLVVPPSTAVLLLVATMVAAFARSDRLGGAGRWALQIVAIVGCLVGGLGVVGLVTYLQSVFVANWDDALAFGSSRTGWSSGARSASAIASALMMGIPGAVLSVAVAFVAWRVLLWGDVQAGGPDERGPDDADDAGSASDRVDLGEHATVLADRPPGRCGRRDRSVVGERRPVASRPVATRSRAGLSGGTVAPPGTEPATKGYSDAAAGSGSGGQGEGGAGLGRGDRDP